MESTLLICHLVAALQAAAKHAADTVAMERALVWCIRGRNLMCCHSGSGSFLCWRRFTLQIQEHAKNGYRLSFYCMAGDGEILWVLISTESAVTQTPYHSVFTFEMCTFYCFNRKCRCFPFSRTLGQTSRVCSSRWERFCSFVVLVMEKWDLCAFYWKHNLWLRCTLFCVEGDCQWRVLRPSLIHFSLHLWVFVSDGELE